MWLQIVIYVCVALYLLTVASVIFNVILENRNPVRTLAWIIVLVTIPLLGFLFYLYFGVNYRKIKMFSRKGLGDMKWLQYMSEDQKQLIKKSEYLQRRASAEVRKLMTLLLNNSKALLTRYNTVEVLNNGQETFPALFDALRQARKFIHLEYYILGEGRLLSELESILLAKAAEGAQDWYLGSIGDLETAAVNPIRDTIFAGNQELYDLWGSLNMTVAGMCIPVGHAVNGAAGLGKSAVIKAAGRTIVTETVKDRAVDYVSGEITTFATEHLNLNQVQSAALNIGLNLGLDKGADWAGQKIGITEGPKFTDRMSYEDAKRYNQFMSEAELGIHNNHPGMSQADLDAWKLADAKVEEQLAVNKVNWDEVTALRAKELEAQKYHLNNSDGELQAKKPLENGPYIKDGKPKGRPQLHGKKKLEFEQEVYNNCVDPDGILRDPNTKQVIDWKPGQPRKDVVDFGHRPGYSYHEMFLKYKNQEISLDELKEFQFDPENYRLETPSANRSHKYE